MHRVSAIFLLISVTVSLSYGQQLRFHHLTSDDGLPSNAVNTIMQDTKGFMWFGTKNGISRYDGYSFRNFAYSPNDPNTINDDFVECIAEDKQGNLWVGTHKSLNKIDGDTYKIARLDTLFGAKVSRVDALLPLDDKLWVGTNMSGLFCLSLDNLSLKNYQHTPANPRSLIDNSINAILALRNGNLLIATSEGLDEFNPKTQQATHILEGYDVRKLNYLEDDTVFVGVLSSGSFYFELDKQFNLKKVEIPITVGPKIVNMLVDSNRRKWTVMQNNGALVEDLWSNKEQRLLFDKYQPYGINSNNFTYVYEDSLANIWLTTNDSGVNIYEKNKKAFLHIKDNFSPTGLRNNRIKCMYQDAEKHIWLGTTINGTLAKFNTADLTFSHYKVDPSNPQNGKNNILGIADADPGFLWLGTATGLYKFNKKTGKSVPVTQDGAKPKNNITQRRIKALFKDGDSLYVGCASGGVQLYDVKNDQLTYYNASLDKTSLSSDKIRSFYKDHSGAIWIGTAKGLNFYDKKRNRFVRYLHDPQNKSSLSDNRIVVIFEDSKDRFWVGTRSGLNVMNRKNGSFKSYTTLDGLPASAIYGILEDDHQNLWISTNNGLSEFDPETEIFKNYTVADGLQANEFAPFVSCKLNSGELLFGGNNGFNIFDPEAIEDIATTPQVRLTNFKLFNQNVPVGEPDSPLKKDISNTKEITLNYEQSAITINYVALNYTSLKNNQYAYKMEGLDKEWNYVGSKQDANYTNLAPGNYIFKVKASNSYNEWGAQEATLKISILPPPWKTWWAYLLYALGAFLLFLGYRHYSRKLIEEEKALELEQMKLNFFVNISHELRTPLTLMINPLENIAATDNIEKIKMLNATVKRHTNKLLGLVNELLDYRKVTLGQIKLRARELNIVALSREVFEEYAAISAENKVKMHFEATEDEIDVWIDKEKFEKVMHNLLSNAVKFTPSGSINLSIQKVLLKKVNSGNRLKPKQRLLSYVEIAIKDTGIGLSKEDQLKLFQRFFQANDSLTGTGIGLNYTQSLVAAHGGKISVVSEKGSGSIFTVKLPLGKAHFRDEEIMHSNDAESPYENIFSDPPSNLNNEMDILETHPDNIKLDATRVKNEGQKLPVVLVVEDHAELRAQIKEALKSAFIIKEAADGQEGWEKTLKHFPDLVVSDIMMPVMDGVTLCNKIKTSIETSHIPVVLLTAKNEIESKIEGFDVGADAYVVKPFNIKILLAQVTNIINTRRRLKSKFADTKGAVAFNELAPNNIDQEFLDKVTSLILDNIEDQNFTLTKLQADLGMSRTNFYVKINALTGTSPSLFIRTTKLNYAAELLKHNKQRVSEIGYESGFNSPAYFTKVFKEAYGITPLEYQRKHVDRS